ncbi:putative zinc-binding protein [Paraburkholderia dinghuensis]|uniref:Zinc-binding protein n=1 Tax=Paraburkholderia dinghuensis TaxID=2305225 RepID=A0A3N6PSE3_9BURK|nr:putative zinc-binding protein [Paraburkholderia dinghuensis]RQH04880.1 zinc-binding protein [Paraburkholderia dinghuensis]
MNAPQKTDKSFPLVYSCSGCSSAAQTANKVAIVLDREHVAEMSCIAGVGGDVPKLVKVAKSGRPIIGIDGCALACVKNVLRRHGVEPAVWHELSQYEVEKIYGQDYDPENVAKVTAIVKESLSVLDC